MNFEYGFQDISNVRWQRVSTFGSRAAENSPTHGAEVEGGRRSEGAGVREVWWGDNHSHLKSHLGV